MGVIYFNGVSSESVGIQVESPPGYIFPSKDVETIHIPGRNGDLIIDKGIYQNVNREYEVSIVSFEHEFDTFINNLSVWLHPQVGYSRLEDTYDPDCYREAIYSDELSVENLFSHAAKATLTFNCKPQRYLLSGEMEQTIVSGGTITNPTNQIAKPIITVTGSGSGELLIGSYQITISDIDDSLTINSELMDAYNGIENKNYTIILPTGFPKLHPGDNGVVYSGGISEVRIIPRWWTL